MMITNDNNEVEETHRRTAHIINKVYYFILPILKNGTHRIAKLTIYKTLI